MAFSHAVFGIHSPSLSSSNPVCFDLDGKSSDSSASSEAICFDFSYLLNEKSPGKRNEEDMSTSSTNSNMDDNDETMSCQSNIDVLHDVNIPEPNAAAPTDAESTTALAKALLNNTESFQISTDEERGANC